MAITETTFVQRIPDTKDGLVELLAHANKAFLEQREVECELWIARAYALLDKEHSRLSAQTPHPELTDTD